MKESKTRAAVNISEIPNSIFEMVKFYERAIRRAAPAAEKRSLRLEQASYIKEATGIVLN